MVSLEEQKKSEQFKIYEAKVSDIFWEMDPAGYFLIRPNRDTRKIEVAFVNNDHEILFQVNGVTPAQIYSRIATMGFKLRPEHWAYLGKELEKVYIAIQQGIEYVQDSRLDFSKVI